MSLRSRCTGYYIQKACTNISPNKKKEDPRSVDRRKTRQPMWIAFSTSRAAAKCQPRDAWKEHDERLGEGGWGRALYNRVQKTAKHRSHSDVDLHWKFVSGFLGRIISIILFYSLIDCVGFVTLSGSLSSVTHKSKDN